MKKLLLAVLLFSQGAPQVGTGSGSIAGQILRSNGVPVKDLRVAAIELSETPPTNLSSSAELLVSTARTDDSGHYVLLDVPSGRYLVAAGQLGAAAYFPGTWDRNSATPVNVTPGGTQTSVDFRVSYGAITGRAISDQNRPLAGVEVGAIPVPTGNPAEAVQNGRGNQSPRSQPLDLSASPWVGATITNSEGEFALNNLAPGNYYVSAGSKDMTDINMSFTARSVLGIDKASEPTLVTVEADSSMRITFLISRETAQNWEVFKALRKRPGSPSSRGLR